MCRMLGGVSQDRTSLRHELLDAERALLKPTTATNGSNPEGWGIAVYPHGDGEGPECTRCPDGTASADGAADKRGRILMAHVRSATQGELTDENTHPFCLGEYAFCHSGDLGHHESLLGLADGVGPRGQTDSERLFHRLLRDVDPEPEKTIEGLRRSVAAAATCGPLSALNFLFSNGERLYAYRLGAYELHWLAREGQVLVSSDRVTDEKWHDVRQDVLLVLAPGDDEPHAERLLGDDAVANVEFVEPQQSGAAAAARE
jgi:predicted glutamine amidotransferase